MNQLIEGVTLQALNKKQNHCGPTLKTVFFLSEKT